MLRQYNYKGRRWYYDGEQWYTSVTEFVKNSLPTPPHLLKWYKENSEEHIDATLRDTSRFGTEFHEHMEVLLTRKKVGAEFMSDRMKLFVAAGAQYLWDHSIKPIAVEQRLSYIEGPVKLAGTVDLIATTPSSEALKRIKIVDWKTGNITEYHKYQMMCYALAYCQSEDSVVDSVDDIELVNVRPKEWRGATPSYEAKKWRVTSEDWEKLDAMKKIFNFDEPAPRPHFEEFTLGQQPTWDTVPAEHLLDTP